MGIGALAVLIALMPTASAQDAPPFTAGRGMASADIAELAPTSGGVRVRMAYGATSVAYRDRTFSALAAPLDVPILALLGGLSICGRSAPDLAATLPPAAVADTARTGEAEQSAEKWGPTQTEAAAAPGSHAEATAVTDVLAVPGVVEIRGGESRSSVTTDAASMTRRAEAEVRFDAIVLLGGLVTLRGPAWHLDQTQVGPDDRADERSRDATFTVDGIEVAGAIPLPLLGNDPMAQGASALNRVLGHLGIVIRPPVITTTPGRDAHQITPLTIAVTGPEVLRPLVATLAGNRQLQELLNQGRGALWDPEKCEELAGLLGAIPELQTWWNLVGSAEPILTSVLISLLAGGGELQVNLGGVRTSLDDAYVDPIEFGRPAVGSPAPRQASTVPTPPTSSPATAPPNPSPATNIQPAPSPRPVPALVASRLCATTSPAGRPGCWPGRAPLAAAVILGVTALVAIADERYRRCHTTPEGAE